MHHFIFPVADTYVTNRPNNLETKNFGIDEILQVGTQNTVQSYADHALLQFDIGAISQSISTGDIVNPSFHLKVKICNEYQLPITYTIYAAPISESWVMGNGYMSDGGSNTGASWIFRDYTGGNQWTIAGGTWIPTYCTQSFTFKSADIDMDVTPIVNQWLAGLPNFGFVILSSDEFHPTGSGFMLKYFSENTNTIYSPVLDVGWDDSVFVTGSISTGSVQITQTSGSSTTIQSGSSLIGGDGVYGNFTSSVFMTIQPYYDTASNVQLTGSFIEEFTGSLIGEFYGIAIGQGYYTGSGGFTASFTGSIDGTDIELTSSAVMGTNVAGYIINDVSMPSLLGTFSGSLQGAALAVMGYVSGVWLDQNYNSFTAYLSGSGVNGNIQGVPVWGSTQGLIAQSNTIVSLPNEIQSSTETSPMESPYSNASVGAMFPPNSNPYEYIDLEWIWGGDDCGWSSLIPVPTGSTITCSCGISHSVQLITGSFTDGPFAGCTFTAYYANYQIIFASLTGSWTNAAIEGASVSIPSSQQTYPYVTAYINGEYVAGNALGIYTPSGSYSASFNGQFTTGELEGDTLLLQLSGSTSTSSYSYTSSVQLTSSVLTALDINQPFSINLSNLQEEYEAGDIIKLNVFGRMKFPLKYFGISTQQEQYLIPQYLPSASYYALKDNQTEEIVVNFDSGTRISCQYPSGNYFLIDTTGLAQERYYRVLIRVEDGITSDTIDTGKIFKITR